MPRRPAVLLLICVAVASSTASPAAAQPRVPPGPVPRATCGPGSLPETGMQGRIEPTDVTSGRAAVGYTCNTEEIGHFASRAGWKMARYGDCAYYNADPGGVPLGLVLNPRPGTYVLDVSNPRQPVETDFLRTPAMASPHESMSIDAERGLLYAVFANLATAPGSLEIWDLKPDCRHPRLVSNLPSSLLGHEGTISRDGKTYYAGSLYAHTLTAVDVTNPLAPTLISLEEVKSHGMGTNPDGTRLYDTVKANDAAPGLVIYDTTEIQQRKPGARFRQISTLAWPERSTPQHAFHITIDGHPYLVETDEFGDGETIGAARIIDIADETKPRVVSNVRLEVHMPANQATVADDTTPLLGGPYTGHYCSVPSYVDPGILACSMLRSGVRVFDIRDPHHPQEIAYFSPPAVQGSALSGDLEAAFHTGANVEFMRERGEMWVTGQETGFHVVRFTNGVWPFTSAPAAPPSEGGMGGEPAAGPATPTQPAASTGRAGGPLAATGLPIGGTLLAVVVAAAAFTLARHRRRYLPG